jgi:hypothetical protein
MKEVIARMSSSNSNNNNTAIAIAVARTASARSRVIAVAVTVLALVGMAKAMLARSGVGARTRLGVGVGAGVLAPLILGEVTEDERARWMRMLVSLGLAGLIIVFSPDIISFMTGLSIPANPVDNVNNNTGNPPPDGLEDSTGLPINTVRAMANLFLILRFLGVAVAVAGGVFSAVKL